MVYKILRLFIVLFLFFLNPGTISSFTYSRNPDSVNGKVQKDSDNSENTFTENKVVYLTPNFVNGKNVLTQNMLSKANTCYVIRYDYDLLNSEVIIPKGCTLDFQGGSIRNGTIIGVYTKIGTYNYAVLGTCKIDGSWLCRESSTLMFDKTINDNLLFVNLSKLSRAIRVYDNKEYFVTKESVRLDVDKFYAVGEKPIIHFINGDNGEFNNIGGFIFYSKDLLIENIKFTEDFNPETSNNHTIGSALAQKYVTRNTNVTLKLRHCEFTGSYASSCFASSYTTDVEVSNCNFHNCYLADHAVYSSINTCAFKIKNCKAIDVSKTNSLFKVRESPNFVLYEVDGLYAKDVASYLFHMSLITDEIDRNVNINMKRIDMIRTSDNIGNGTFALLNTGKFDGKAKVNTIRVEECNLFGGQYNKVSGSYKERPLFAVGSGQSVIVKTIIGNNNHIEKLSIEQANVEKTVINNSYYSISSPIYANDIYIEDSVVDIYRPLNYFFVRPKNVYIKNVSINGGVVYLCLNNQLHRGVNNVFSLNTCKINKLSRNVFDYKNVENPQLIYYEEINCDIIRGNYPLVSNSNKPVILKNN